MLSASRGEAPPPPVAAWPLRAWRTLPHLRRLAGLDAVLIALAVLMACVSLAYPFGGDQGLYYYVGREWLQGAIPYRDTMEQKTPLIFLLHAVLIALTGENMWAIRAAELLWVLVVGWTVAELATAAGEPPAPGMVGLASFATAVSYFGLFNYWDTAQCEIWYAGLSLLSLRVVVRAQLGHRTVVLGGLLGGLACLMKPPAALLLVVVVLALAERVWRAAGATTSGSRATGSALLAYGAGAIAPVVVTVLYFYTQGALADLVDIAFRANHHDMVHSASVADAAGVLGRLGEFWARAGLLGPFVVTLALGAIGLAVGARSRPAIVRQVVGALLLSAGVATVIVQRKFYGYHWGVLAPLVALVLAGAAAQLARTRGFAARFPAWCAPALVAVLVVLAFAATEGARDYVRTADLTVRYLAGTLPREEFLAPFVVRNNTPYVHQEVVGRWIARHSVPSDLVAVRGFEQTIYAVAGRRSPSRFFWTRWLTEPERAYRRTEWLAEDQVALRLRPPRYIVVSAYAKEGPASQAHFASEYGERFRHGRLVVLERR